MDTVETNTNGTRSQLQPGNKATKDTKVRRHLPSLPSATSATEMTVVAYSGLSDKTPVEWTFLKNYEIFSLSPDGSFAMMKVSRSKAVRLSDREVLMVGGGRCYRVRTFKSLHTNTMSKDLTVNEKALARYSPPTLELFQSANTETQ